MAFAKAVVDFSKVSDGEITGPAHEIHHNMLVVNTASFAGAPFTAAAFLTIITNWEQAFSESLKGGKDRKTLKDNARAALEDALFQLGTFVNLTANGDQAIIDLSGFPSYTTDKVQSTGGVTFIPLNVRWDDGTVSGEEILRWKGDGTHAMYEVQTCTGDPNLASNWSYRGSFSGGKAVLNGFTPGSTSWGRVRKIGTGGKVGDWSDPAQVMAS